jgi:hypothetical protein
VMAEAAHLFAPRAAEEIRYFNPKAHTGDMLFRGENPAAGALIDYYLASDPGATGSSVAILDAAGKPVAALKPTHEAGINRIVWNLRYDALPAPPPDEESGGRPTQLPGPFVMPGEYTVRLTVGDHTFDQKLQVLEDPRVQVPAADRHAWTDAQLGLAETYRGTIAVLTELGQSDASPDLRRIARELQSSIVSLYRAIGDSTGKPTADQQSQAQFYETELESLRARARR